MKIYHFYGIDENGNIRPFQVISDNLDDGIEQARKMPLKMITYTWAEPINDDYFKEV